MTSVAADGDHYFVTTNDTVYMTTTTRTRSLGSPQMLATGQSTPQGVVTSKRGTSVEVYWVNYGSGEIMRATIAADGTAGVASPIATDVAGVWAVDVTPNDVFWTNKNSGEVWHLALDAAGTPGKQTLVASGQAKPAWLLCNGMVFWTNTSSGEIVSASFDSSSGTWTAKPIFSGRTSPAELDVDGYAMYWIEGGGTSVQMAVRNGVSFDTPTPLASSGVGLASVQCTEIGLLWTTVNGDIVSAPRDTTSHLPGTPGTIAEGQTGVAGLAAPTSTGSLGWITSGGGGEVVELLQ